MHPDPGPKQDGSLSGFGLRAPCIDHPGTVRSFGWFAHWTFNPDGVTCKLDSVETTTPLKNDPREVRAYTVLEAARLVRVPVSTLKTWLHGEGVSSRGLIHLPRNRPRLLAFSHLVEAFVLAAIRRGHGIALQRVRKAIGYVKRELHVERPLIHAKFKTDGVDLFIEHWGKLVNTSSDGQIAMRGAIESSLRRVDWDPDGRAVRLFPLVRADDAAQEQPRTIVIDPMRGFGRPTLVGKGVRVDVIVERYRAGESPVDLAKDYRVAVDLIHDAVRCELRAAS